MGKTLDGTSLEGLLPNSRMVQGIFDDLNPETRHLWNYPDTGEWDADRNTNEFVRAMPEWNDVARAYARVSNGIPHNSLLESVLNMSVTAHILGGCPIGADAQTGVIDARHEVFGHPGLYLMDASAIPANVGVNPSLTITALAERAAGLIPQKR